MSERKTCWEALKVTAVWRPGSRAWSSHSREIQANQSYTRQQMLLDIA